MFSGLTNQVSSWMGAAKGEPQDEEVPTPTKEPVDGSTGNEAEKPHSPTKGGSKLDMLTNVKSQVSGWLGSGIPIPGLRKGNEANAETEPSAQPLETDGLNLSAEAGDGTKEDDDNSRYNSATGGADSRPASGGGTPTEEQPAGVGNVTTKAVAGAKSIGNFLYSAVNKAGAKVSEASAKIKKTVEENSILGEFNREQDAFIKGQKSKGAAVPPWSGHPNEHELKEECLLLSTDLQNFVREPPVDFEFNYDVSYPIATAIMDEDPNLQKMRFELVPKVITEENFWRNYFYRVSLICRANEPEATGEGLDTFDAEIRLSPVIGPEHSNESKNSGIPSEENKIKEQVDSKSDLENVKSRIRLLKVDEANKNEEEWEKELEAELRDYEVVTGDKNSATAPADDKQWENECEELLGDEDEDLK